MPDGERELGSVRVWRVEEWCDIHVVPSCVPRVLIFYIYHSICRHSSRTNMSSDSNNTIASVKKNSKYIASKAHRIKQMLKPMMKFLHKRCQKFETRQHQPAVPQSTTGKPAEFVVSEVDQNSANEALESRLRHDMIQKSEECGGVIGVWNEGRMTLVPVTRGHNNFSIPVHFACTPSGDFVWAPLPDSDICWRGDVQTTGQTAEKQVPVGQKTEI